MLASVRDDAELLELWSSGDKVAGRELYERHYRAVYRFFQTKVGTNLEDLVQDTFTACIASRARVRDRSSFRAYLFGIARNVLRQSFRRARVRGVVVDIDECSAHDLEPSPASLLVKKAEQRLLLEALRRLPLDHQLTFELYYWESLTADEMADVLGISERGVRSRIHRAKQQLEQKMTEIADSAEVLDSTVMNLERWAAALRTKLGDARGSVLA
jgi:RNA polymerase sigma factor (sigma-70 family)